MWTKIIAFVIAISYGMAVTPVFSREDAGSASGSYTARGTITRIMSDGSGQIFRGKWSTSGVCAESSCASGSFTGYATESEIFGIRCDGGTSEDKKCGGLSTFSELLAIYAPESPNGATSDYCSLGIIVADGAVSAASGQCSIDGEDFQGNNLKVSVDSFAAE